MSRRKVTLQEVREYTGEFDKSLGIMAIIDVDNMGFCKDGVTRWYTFDMDGESCIYFKH